MARRFPQLGATPMPDNSPDDKYVYEIAIFTGMRRNAGTLSKVSLTESPKDLLLHTSKPTPCLLAPGDSGRLLR